MFDETLEKQVDEIWNYLINKLIESNKDNDFDWSEIRGFYGAIDGWTWTTNGVKNKQIVATIEPMPKGYHLGVTRRSKR